jgi:hypothetical protein
MAFIPVQPRPPRADMDVSSFQDSTKSFTTNYWRYRLKKAESNGILRQKMCSAPVTNLSIPPPSNQVSDTLCERAGLLQSWYPAQSIHAGLQDRPSPLIRAPLPHGILNAKILPEHCGSRYDVCEVSTFDMGQVSLFFRLTLSRDLCKCPPRLADLGDFSVAAEIVMVPF